MKPNLELPEKLKSKYSLSPKVKANAFSSSWGDIRISQLTEKHVEQLISRGCPFFIKKEPPVEVLEKDFNQLMDEVSPEIHKEGINEESKTITRRKKN